MKKWLFIVFVINSVVTQAQTADQWFEMAYDKYENHDYAGAISDYTECIMLTPEFPEAYFNRGLSNFFAGFTMRPFLILIRW
jgi:hypothetical protein